MDYPQGDVRLLDTEIAQRLLRSTIPARLAYTAADGTPRIVPSWHVWTGSELVMSTYIYCPPMGMMKPAARLAALRARPDVAVSIDSEPQPPDVLQLRGRVTITEVEGMVPEQAEAARRFLGEEGGAAYVAGAAHPETRMARIALRPEWVGVLDFRTRVPGMVAGNG
ncbi:hypothetical protein BJY24_007604 [Nocardia transvalensis]|uniref:Pyridoxamine 5'-phosphate oxidase n=1 Tax=Nocardia transvalensis TaxID=37333 RepID=A0A7W9UMT1_9NOCA|nr:pyridoxamine 5'-phosphate oxidase [Nocardia transvalensis]MBB5918692.1 hypothetical protein [Nocardia transvalensis]